MKREDLKNTIGELFEKEILSKFMDRNASYGSEDGLDAFYNFRQTGTRLAMNSKINLNELDTMLLPLFTYTDKHQVALMQHLSKTKECEDRIVDIIVYSFIALAMMKEHYGSKVETYPGVISATKLNGYIYKNTPKDE